MGLWEKGDKFCFYFYFVSLWYEGMYSCVWEVVVGAHAYVSVCECGGQRSMLDDFFSFSPLYFMKQALTKPGAHSFN